ncbi:hypothetical protein [Peribacillus sp. B2I2]|uniref:hypothetical protein n=1 Tax=Peribacillus sp. B2I2 TaxID=3156468 RepID=UPI0035161733
MFIGVVACNKDVAKEGVAKEADIEKFVKDDDRTIDYKYTIKFKLYDEDSSKVYDKEGELTISTKDNVLKITRDWSRGVKIDGLDGGL